MRKHGMRARDRKDLIEQLVQSLSIPRQHGYSKAEHCAHKTETVFIVFPTEACF